MGIKRCPYCRSLISEQDQYCKNCGTQLLFPEDEEIEEEIPGDRIIEDTRGRGEIPEQELTEEELPEERMEEEVEEVILIDEEAEELEVSISLPETSSQGETPARKTETEGILFPPDEVKVLSEEKSSRQKKIRQLETEDELLKKIKAEVLKEKEAKPVEAGTRGPGLVTQMVEELREKERKKLEQRTSPGPVTRMVEELKKKEDEEEGLEQPPEPGLVTRLVQELEAEESEIRASDSGSRERTAGVIQEPEESSPSLTFETAELEKIGPTVELGRRQVEDFFKVLEEKEKERLKERSRLLEESGEETGEVPSWIKEVKAVSTEILTEGEETSAVEDSKIMETEADKIWPEEGKPSTPTIGFPENITRSPMDFEIKDEDWELATDMRFEREKEEEEFEELGRRDTAETTIFHTGEVGAEEKGVQALPSLGFMNFIKAKVFDLLLIIMFWLISVWMAARSMGTTIFKLFDLAANGLLLYLLILIFFYFFLFYFFIGETLGDRLFREEGEEDLG